MAEPDKRQIGDGSDNYGEAAKQMAKAAKEAGIETAKQAAVKGAEAGANAAAATVQAGVEGGKAVAEIAAGTAAGGPWGAILSAAWAMRHTLFKILVCICLFFLVIIVLIVSLPSVVTNSVFGLDGSMVDMENPTTLLESYNHLAADISAVVEEGYDAALAKVEQIIEDGGYDYDTYGISAAELLPGDLGFLADDDGWGHVLIFAGYDAEGTRMWVHSSGGIGVILNTPSYEGRLSYRRLSIVDYDAPVVNSPNGEALYTLEVEVTHYCACAKCCGSNAQGLTASGKQAAVGMR